MTADRRSIPESYYPAHASRPVLDPTAPGAIDIWDNTELTALEAWREWFNAGGENSLAAYWAKVDCIECELGRSCQRLPKCVGVCATCGYLDCECDR